MTDIQKKYYSISEVSKELDMKQSAIRFYCGYFDYMLEPKRTKANRRQFTRLDIELLKRINNAAQDVKLKSIYKVFTGKIIIK